MFFDFGPKSGTLLIFFSQGIVFSFLLLKKGIQNQNSSSKWLSLFVFLCSLYIAPFMLGYANWYQGGIKRETLFFVPFQQLFLLGPVLYFYTQSLLDASFRLQKRDWIHFTPAILYLLYSLVVFVTDKLVLSEYYFYADGRDKDFSLWYQIAGLVSMLFYLLLSLRYYVYYKKVAFETVSYAESVLFRWLNHFFIAFLIILVLRVLFFILNPEWGQFGRKFWYYLCFSALYYYIAISGFSNTVRATIPLSDSKSNLNEADKQKSKDSSLPDLDSWKTKLEKLMLSEKPYMDSSLTLSDIARQLNTRPKTISKIVNQGFEMNFNDFVNHYRVNAIIEQLKSGQQNTKTLLGIALDCGFNSKATFNRAFKKHTSKSPKEYLVNIS